MAKSSTTLFTLLTFGMLTACGGGGDEGDSNDIPDERVKITADNGQAIARTVWNAIDLPEGLTSSSGFDSDLSTELFKTPPFNVTGFSLKLIGHPITDSASSRLAERAASPQSSSPCGGGGTMTVTLDDKDGNGRLDPGERLTVTLDQCVQADELLNGAFSMVLKSDFEDSAGNWLVEREFTFDDFSQDSEGKSATLDGDLMSVEQYVQGTGILTTRLQGARLDFIKNAQSSILRSFTLTESIDSALPPNYTADYDFTYTGEDIAGTVVMVTDPALAGQLLSPPESGRLSLTGADRSKVAVEAIGNGLATLSVDANDDGDFSDPGDKVVTDTWADLLSDP